MTTAISVLGGVGLFLLGMTVLTDGLKALAWKRWRITPGAPLHILSVAVGSFTPRIRLR